jgi:hypothetical protein
LRRNRHRQGPSRGEDDWDDRRHLFCCEDCTPARDNDIDFESDELGRDLGVTLTPTFRPANLDDDVSTFGPAEVAQPPLKTDDQ